VVAALCFLLLVTLSAASVAGAADRIYWSNDNNNRIAWSNLNPAADGNAGGLLNDGAATPSAPQGIAIDTVTGTAYWANYGLNGADEGVGTTISWARLDDSGVGGNLTMEGFVSAPHGVAIDPRTRRLYWVNYQSLEGRPYGGEIRSAQLNASGNGIVPGSVSAPINSAIQTKGPRSLAIDPRPGWNRIYWANFDHDSDTDSGGDSIAYANLGGPGGGLIVDAAAGETGPGLPNRPEGVAIDPVLNRVYWSDFTPGVGAIQWASLSGIGRDDLVTNLESPHGVAIDPETRRIYWAMFYGPTIRWTGLTNAPCNADPNVNNCSTLLSTPNVVESGPDLPVFLKDPSGAGAPAISGGSDIGDTLSCSQGSWAADEVEALVYQAPQANLFSYQWSRNGTDLAGATSSSYTANGNGEYRCIVTARNAAGTAQQTSSPHTIVSPQGPAAGNNPQNGGKGNDSDGPKARACEGVEATMSLSDLDDLNVHGTKHRDVIIGTKSDEIITGGSGADIICGGGGEDVIKGGRGNDQLFGGKQGDVVFGQGGSDSMVGGKGPDNCIGGSGVDTEKSC